MLVYQRVNSPELQKSRVDITCSSHFLEGFSELKCEVWLANRHEAAMFPPHDRNSGALQRVPVATWVALILWIEWLCWFIRKHILYPFIWKLLNANTKAVLDILVNHEKPSDCRVPYSQTNTYIASKLYPGCSFFPYDSDNSSNFLWIFVEIGTANWRVVSELSWLLRTHSKSRDLWWTEGPK